MVMLSKYTIGWWDLMSLISALRRQRKVDICELEVSLVYRAGSKTVKAGSKTVKTTERNRLEKLQNHKTTT